MKEQTEPFTSGDNDISTVPSHGWNRHFCIQEMRGSSKHLSLIVPRGRHLFPFMENLCVITFLLLA